MSRPESSPAIHCSKLDMCRSFNGDSDNFCPVLRNSAEANRYIDRTMMDPVERLCINAVANFTQTSFNRDPFKQEYNDCIHFLDMSCSHPDMAKRGEYFAGAVDLNESMLAQTDIFSKGRPGYYIKAQILSAYLPAFAARVEGRRPTASEISQVHQNLCVWSEAFPETILNKIPKGDHSARKLALHYDTEVDVFRLQTRLNNPRYFPWMALPREESSQFRSERNHDSYYLDDEGNKNPAQIKTSKKPGGYKGIPVITQFAILNAARQGAEVMDYAWQADIASGAFQSEDQLVPPTIPSIKQLLHEEYTLGRDKMNRHHLNLLNCASMYVVSMTLNGE